MRLLRGVGPFAERRAWLVVAGLGALLGASLALRTPALGAWYWTDEGISVGIAGHPLSAIPGLMRLDGSPPLYYLLLHVWMALFGPGEAATHALSLLLALLTVPAALWAGWSLFGARAGCICAALAALNPFLTVYAQETRMYSLAALLAMLATAAFVHVLVFSRRRYLPLLSVSVALLLYTHAWALFLSFGLVAGMGVCLLRATDRRRVLLDGALGLGAAALVFAPWLPTLLWQAAHTGAPWSERSTPGSLAGVIIFMLGGRQGLAIATLGAVAGLVALPLRRRLVSESSAAEPGREAPDPPRGGSGTGAHSHGGRSSELDRTSALSLAAVLVTGVATAYLAARLSSGWASRYFAVFLSPLLLLLALGIARAGAFGLAALAGLALVWGVPQGAPANYKSNARAVAGAAARELGAGDLVLSTQPEQVPLLAAYIPDRVTYATPLGAVRDPAIMDWTDAMARLRRPAARDPIRLLRGLRAGSRVLLVRPLVGGGPGPTGESPWNALVRLRSTEWEHRLRSDPRLVVERSIAPALRPHQRIAVGALVLRVRRQGRG